MIFFDTDCLSSFFWVNEERLLVDVKLGGLVVPLQVVEELSNPCVPHLGKKIRDLLAQGLMSVGEIMTGTEEACLFYEMTLRPRGKLHPIGQGEAAALALAKVNGGIVGSNNLADISAYLLKYGLKNMTTGCILARALDKNLITEEQGNQIWYGMLARRRILPADSFSNYLKQQHLSACFFD